MWGLIFVGPLIVPEYPAILQSTGRYLALGLIALPLAWLGRTRLRQLSRQDWGTALALTMMGNLIYYVCLASAIQRTGAPVSTMIIGTLPVVIPIFANLLYSHRDGKLAWSKMIPALACTAVGLVCVNIAELRHGLADFSLWRYGSGIVLAFISVACWAWYALRNARWLRENPDKHPMMWATAQALVTLPVSLVGYAGACLWLGHQQPEFAQPFGPRPWVFIGLMVAIAPEAADGDLRAADCVRNPGRAAVHLPDAPERAAAVNGLRDRAAGGGGGDGGKSEAGKTEGRSGFGDVW
ncbi:hypothetical protein ID866_2055 [Astraeus odoratus]|nr:hypothetical protein ID866_2055 [Astraeus odoratus]